MKTLISTVSVAALIGISSIAGIAPARAAMYNHNYQQQDQYIGNFCDRHPDANECNDWRSNHSHWSNNQYQNFYRYHRNDDGFDGNFAAGIFGFAAGALVAGAINNSGYSGYSNDHVTACESAYRSYDVRTDTYLGYDGVRHQCRL